LIFIEKHANILSKRLKAQGGDKPPLHFKEEIIALCHPARFVILSAAKDLAPDRDPERSEG
jgi:hypothetical protein